MPDTILLRSKDGSIRVFAQVAVSREAWVIDWDHESGPTRMTIDQIEDRGPPTVPVESFAALPDTLTMLAPGNSIEVPDAEALSRVARHLQDHANMSGWHRTFADVQQFLEQLAALKQQPLPPV